MQVCHNDRCGVAFIHARVRVYHLLQCYAIFKELECSLDKVDTQHRRRKLKIIWGGTIGKLKSDSEGASRRRLLGVSGGMPPEMFQKWIPLPAV